MDFGKLVDETKELVDDRGGVDSLKEDAEELKDIATGDGSVTDKAKDAVEAIEDPGETGRAGQVGPPQASASTASGMSKLK